MAKIFVSFKCISPDNIILVAKELSNLSAIVYSQYFASSSTQHNVTIDPVNPVMHRIQVWSTTDGVTLSQLKGSCDIDASQTTAAGFSIIQFIVDGGVTGTPRYDPASLQAKYDNPDLIGKEYIVHKNGFGVLTWGLEIQKTATGFQYIDGEVFSPGEEYTVQVATLVTVPNPSTGKGYPVDVVLMTADDTFATTHYNKLIEVNASSNITLTVNDISTIPENTSFGINTQNFSGHNMILQLPVGAFALIHGVSENLVYIGVAENVWFTKKGSYLRIIQWDGDYRRLGERVKSDGIAPFNGLPEVGGWKLKTDYPRAWNWYVNRLPTSNYFTAADDSTVSTANLARWGVGTLKFWVPDVRNMFERNTDGTRTSGDFQDQDVQQHFHPSGVQTNDGGPSDPTPAVNFNRAAPHTVLSWKVATNPPELNQNASTDLNIGAETRPKNIARISYVII